VRYVLSSRRPIDEATKFVLSLNILSPQAPYHSQSTGEAYSISWNVPETSISKTWGSGPLLSRHRT